MENGPCARGKREGDAKDFGGMEGFKAFDQLAVYVHTATDDCSFLSTSSIEDWGLLQTTNASLRSRTHTSSHCHP